MNTPHSERSDLSYEDWLYAYDEDEALASIDHMIRSARAWIEAYEEIGDVAAKAVEAGEDAEGVRLAVAAVSAEVQDFYRDRLAKLEFEREFPFLAYQLRFRPNDDSETEELS